MRLFFRIVSIILALVGCISSIHARDTTTIAPVHIRQLRGILYIDSRDVISRELRTRRNMIFSDMVRALPSLYTTWNLRPTLDTTLRYTPYLQQYALSCEIAALSIVLRALGSPETEDSLISRLPIEPWAYSGGIWGDPDEVFVGSITGSQMGRTGYGVYARPLAALIEGQWEYDISMIPRESPRSSERALGYMSQYLELIGSGSHVILWGDWCTDPQYEDGIVTAKKHRLLTLFPIAAKNPCERTSAERQMKWTTPSGVEISALSGEHAFVLLGYIGPRTRPSHIIVWDTDTGRHIYPLHEWMRKWSLLDYRAFIIHP